MKSFKSYIYILFCFFLTSCLFADTPSIDSLSTALIAVGENEKDEFLTIFEEIKQLKLKKEELLEVETSLQNAILTAQKFENFSKSSKLHALLSNIHILLNANEKAYQSLQKSIQIGKNILSKKEQISILKRIAELSLTMGKYEEAYTYRLQVLKMYEELNDKTGVYSTLYNIGSIFFYQENLHQALSYYQQSQQLAVLAKDSAFLYRNLAAIGSVYGEIGDNDKSLNYNLKSLEMAENMNFDMGIAYAAHNVGLNYEILDLPEKALGYFKQSLQLMRKMGDKFGEANCLQAISAIHSHKQEYQEAIEYLNKSLHILHQLGDRSRIREIYLDMSRTYFNAGNAVKAYEVQKGYIELRDSLIQEEAMQQMANLKQTYELEKKESEKQIAIMEAEQQMEQVYRYAFLVGLSFLLLVAWLFYSRYQEQTSMNKLLAQKNEEIQLQNNKLATSNRELEQFAYIASHDLKEPLRNIGGFTSLLERRYLNEEDEDAKDFMNFISSSVTHMHKLLTDLLMYSRIGMQNEEHEEEYLPLNEVVQQVCSNYQTSLKENEAKIIIDDLPTIYGNRIQMIQLFQNLIGNAIKFRGEDKPEIHIHSAENSKEFILSVKDNGIGMEQEYTDKIFVIFQRLHNRTKYEGTGIGLAICKKIVEQHEGRIWVESQSGKGSTFYFAIPKEKKTDPFSLKTARKATIEA